MYAIMSDNKETLAVFSKPEQEEPEIMVMSEYVSAFGEDALSLIVNLAEEMEQPKPAYNPIDVIAYLHAFKNLVDACGEYKQILGFKKAVVKNKPGVMGVFQELYGGNMARLNNAIEAKKTAQYTFGYNLSVSMRKVNYKPLSFAENIKARNDIGVSDADCLIRLFSNKDIRRKTCEKIEKCLKNVERKSPLEILKEVKASFGENVPEEFKKPSS